jgi:hypothetical protein
MATSITDIYPQLNDMNLTNNQLDFIRNSVFSGKTIDELIAEAESHNEELIDDDPLETEPVSNQLMADVREMIESLLENLPDI